ncbi:MAG: glycine cleavage system aminomethyltransferase GcvT [Deltaproteobacteria bacterium]
MSRTALYEIHLELGAKVVEFAGWRMPVEYSGIREEHLAVRARAGLFDVSHMGEVEVRGRQALQLCQWVLTNDLCALKPLGAQYTLICNEQGGVVDDVIIYKFSQERFFICVNASNTAKDFDWIKRAEAKFDAEVIDRSREFSQLAFQGPDSMAVLAKLLGSEIKSLKRFHVACVKRNGSELLIARTGYTGEDGVEIFLPWGDAPKLWREILDAGSQFCVLPCGLGARDTLRVEMGYPLYGHEIDDTTNPLEAGIGRFVKIGKGDFIGRAALVKVAETGAERKLAGFEMSDKGIPRQGYGIIKNDSQIGAVTSGTLSPSMQKAVGMGYVPSDMNIGDEIAIEIRSARRKAKIAPLPFYKQL